MSSTPCQCGGVMFGDGNAHTRTCPCFEGDATPPAPPAEPPLPPVGDMDGLKWAKSFVAHVKWKPEIATDEGTMVGWFANAIMAGYDEAMRRAAHPPAVAGEDARLREAFRAGFLARCQRKHPDATEPAQILEMTWTFDAGGSADDLEPQAFQAWRGTTPTPGAE